MADLIDQFDAIAPMSVRGMHQAPVDVQHLPGIIIFVHGVNSDGEWYEACEEGLLRGLNRRMGLDQSARGTGLSPVSYAAELLPNGDMNRQLSGKNYIADPGFSPVIRFRWGYKAAGRDNTEGSEDEKAVYGSRIYLNELDAWGGGPFQNGTSALPYMWGLGLDDRVFWWIYANMFPVDGREVYASPPRAYYAHAAHRLKELIKAIREKQPDCPITVVCHSQGNMVTLGAAMLGEKEDALADTYVLSNPPYSLESLGMDKMVNDDSKSATGQFGSVTTVARKTTMANFLALVKKRGAKTRGEQPLEVINRYHEFIHPESKEQLFKLAPFPGSAKAVPAKGIDRDNRGRTFLYCNPHDQVIGVTPVQGIGWRGVSQAQLGDIGADGVFHQRVWAMAGGEQSPAFSVGAPDWTERAYRYIQDNHDPKRFWNPPAPRMRFTLALNESQGALSKIVTVATAPILWLVTRLYGFSINDDPKKDWAVPITAPALPQPHTPKASRYGRSTDFDQGHDPSRDALASTDDKDKLKDGAHGGQYDEGGQGDVSSEAGLRYEIKARLLREKRLAEKRGETVSEDDERASVKRMLAENPNATDHSTILTCAENSERVLAYDVAVGWVNPNKITKADLQAFRQFAHWMMLKAAVDKLPVAEQFVDYWQQGFYQGQQLHQTYTMAHMESNAPGIKDDRERNLLGRMRA